MVLVEGIVADVSLVSDARPFTDLLVPSTVPTTASGRAFALWRLKMEKACTKCGETKPLGEFCKDKKTKDGHRHVCRECGCAQSREWHAANRDQANANSRAWHAANKEWVAARGKRWYEANSEQVMDSRLQRTYGISRSEYDEMLEVQDSCCAICGKTVVEEGRRLAVDHNHETGENRGLLCGRCNPGLGYFMHDPELLCSAIAYLERWTKVTVLETK